LEIVQPEFQVAEESLIEIADQLPAIFVRYGNEHANAPLDVDWQTMFRMSATGMLRLVVARHNKQLVGFCLNLLTRPIMYKSTLYGTTVATWLDKPYRYGLNGYKLLKTNRDLLESWGCQRMFIATDKERLGTVFERLGYKYSEHSFMRQSDAGLSV
jgi:hypothetical protein